jgi:DNA polymerase-3 subunit delta
MYQVQNLANQLEVKISRQASLLLVEAVGNNTRLLYNELEKLKTYTGGLVIHQEAVVELVNNSSGNALKLASAILNGDTDTVLQITENLLRCNEPPLKITATLVTTFRTWLTVKVCTTEGWQNDNAIASLAEIKNPKRLYFLRNEVANVSIERLRQALPLLLELELMLIKSGTDERLAMQTQLVQLCH